MAMTAHEEAELKKFRDSLNTSSFTTEPYVRKVEKPWGFEIHFTPDHLPYMGKILHVDEGMRISLQVHDKKQESWYLAYGKLILIIENPDGEMEEVQLEQGVGYTCALGQKHRLKGGQGGGAVFEVSTPELGNTYRIEDDFERTTETEAAREERNKEAQ